MLKNKSFNVLIQYSETFSEIFYSPSFRYYCPYAAKAKLQLNLTFLVEVEDS